MSHSIVFLGTSAFAVPSLRALAAEPAFRVQLVITQPDRPTGRKQFLTPSPVKLTAQELHLPIEQPEDINTFHFPLPAPRSPWPSKPWRSGLGEVGSSFHFLVVVSYGQILSEKILMTPTIAPINLHASLLPKFRGASPLQHTILAGDSEGGVTVQRMVQELDAGPILTTRSLQVDTRETFTSLHDKLALLGATLLVHTLKSPLQETNQDSSKATICKKLSRQDGIVNAETMTAEEIDRKVRALEPWPGVTLDGNKILETSLEEHPEAMPLICKDDTKLFVLKIQRSGGKPISGVDFSRSASK